MRFRFCGDLECPDWILCEIAFLSTLDLSSTRIITQQVLSSSLEGTFDHEKVAALIIKDKKDEVSNLKGMIICIHFIIINAAKYDVDDISLIREIQQLGLPNDTADFIGYIYQEHKEQLQHHLADQSYRISRLLSTDWKVISSGIRSNNASGNISNRNNQSYITSLETPEEEEKDSSSRSSINRSNTTNQAKIYLKMQVDLNPNGRGINNARSTDVATSSMNESNTTSSSNHSLSAVRRNGISSQYIKELSFEMSSDKLDLLIHELSVAYSTLQHL